MAITYIPPAFRPTPYENPWERNMPSMYMTMLQGLISTMQKKAGEKREERLFEERLPYQMLQAGYKEAKPSEEPMEGRDQPERTVKIGKKQWESIPFQPSGKLVTIDGKKFPLVQTGRDKWEIGKRDVPTAIEEKLGILTAAHGGVTPENLEDLVYGRPQWDVIQSVDPKTGEINPVGEQQYHRKGAKIPQGFKVVKVPPVQVQIGEKPASAQERTAIASGRASIDNLDNLRTLFNRAYTGPVAGRVGKAKDIFGLNPQAQSEFYAATAAFKNSIIKEITGAQMSEVEAKRIMKQVPDINDPPRVWMAKWKQSKQNLETLQTRRLQILEESGLKVPGKFTSKGTSYKSAEEVKKDFQSGILKEHQAEFILKTYFGYK